MITYFFTQTDGYRTIRAVNSSSTSLPHAVTGRAAGASPRLTISASPDIQLFLHIVEVDGQHPGNTLLLRRRKVHSVPNALAGIGRSISLRLLSPPDPLRWARVGAPHAGAGNILFTGYSTLSPHR